MCSFLSALVLRNGDLRLHPMLDSHGDLVRYFKIPDALQGHQHFAKVELTPVDWMDVSTWKFKLDEATAPGWWADVATAVEVDLRRRADAMILREGEHELIVDGCWIIGGKAKVRDVRSGRIMRVQGNASVQNVWGNASIQNVWGNASVQNVGGNASIQNVWGNASVQDVRDHASVQNVRDHASVQNVRDHASVQNVWGNASVQNVGDHASIQNVGGNATLDESAKAHVLNAEPPHA